MANSIAQLREENYLNSLKKIVLYNPENEDFTCTFQGKSYTAPAHQIKEFDYHVGKHIKKHLIDFIYQNRDMTKRTYDSVIQELEKEVDYSGK